MTWIFDMGLVNLDMGQLWCVLKLSLDDEILNLGLMRFILIYYVLGLINWTYILVINLKFLN